MWHRIAAPVALGLALASTAVAGTDFKNMENLVKKYGPQFGSVFGGAEISAALKKAKTPCICHDTDLFRQVGFIVYQQFDQGPFTVDCYLATGFAPDGSILGAAGCLDFTPLGK
jgi:hypothetical protein